MSRLSSILVPAAVFQSVIVGGAYGTGREVVEFISSYGALGGLLVIGLVACGFAAILATSFEFARTFSAWDYRRFLRELLGPAWVCYELMFAALLVIILAVTGAAAGEVLAGAFEISPIVGVALLFGLVTILNILGREFVKRSLTIGALVLSASLLAYCFIVFSNHDAVIRERITVASIDTGWWLSGIKFAVYNSALIPVLIFCAEGVRDRISAIGAGVLAGLLGVLPALLFHLSFIAGFPDVLHQALPTFWMLENFAPAIAIPIYMVILFATIVQTGVGVLHGLNERIDGWYEEVRGKQLPPVMHGAIAAVVLLASLALSKLGIIALIAKGYGTLAWGFFFVFSLPMLTIGIRKIHRRRANA